MQSDSRVRQYCQSVVDQIRWHRSHSQISMELENHIMDQRDGFMKIGIDEEEAIEMAVKEMGDPIVVGAQLDRIHKPKAQWGMIGLTIMLVLIGFVFRYLMSKEFYGSLFVGRQLFGISIGIGLMMLLYFLDFSIIGKYPLKIFAVTVMLSIVLRHMDYVIDGRSYLYMGPVCINMGYLTLIYPVVLSALIYSMRNMGYKGMAACFGGIVLMGGILIELQMFYGTMQFLIISWVLMCCVCLKNWFGVNRVRSMLLMGMSMLV